MIIWHSHCTVINPVCHVCLSFFHYSIVLSYYFTMQSFIYSFIIPHTSFDTSSHTFIQPFIHSFITPFIYQQEEQGITTSKLFSEIGLVGLLEQAAPLFREVCTVWYLLTYKESNTLTLPSSLCLCLLSSLKLLVRFIN